jgi:hypothetical protein
MSILLCKPTGNYDCEQKQDYTLLFNLGDGRCAEQTWRITCDESKGKKHKEELEEERYDCRSSLCRKEYEQAQDTLRKIEVKIERELTIYGGCNKQKRAWREHYTKVSNDGNMLI